MKYLLFRFSAFSVFLLIAGAVSGLFQSAYFYAFPYELPGDIDTVIAGNSTVGVALDPDIIEGSVNVAQGAETFEASWYKIRYILSTSKQINYLILSISPENFSDYNIVGSRPEHLGEMTNIGYYNLIPWREFVISKNLQQWSDVKNKILATFFNVELIKSLIVYGEYYPFASYRRGKVGVVSENEKQYLYTFNLMFGDEKINDLSLESEGYLEKIIILCQEAGVQLLLIRPPVHVRHRDKIPEKFQDYYTSVQNSLANTPNVTLLDYSSLDVQDEWFWDYIHLNVMGSKFISELVAEHLQTIRKEISRHGNTPTSSATKNQG